MKIAVTYTVIPSYGEASSLHLQYDSALDDRANYWTHFGGLGVDSLDNRPWWMSKTKGQVEPNFMNAQTTNLIMNLLSNLAIKPVSEFVKGDDGVTHELEFFAGFNKSKYVWWGELPNEWSELSAFTSFLDGFLSGKR